MRELCTTLIGERWEIGSTVLEVSEPRVPCWRLGVRMEDQMFPRRFTDALRPGAYLRIIVEGNVGAGDEIRVTFKPLHDLTIRDFFRIYTRDRAGARAVELVSPGYPKAGKNGRKAGSRRSKAVTHTQPLLHVVRRLNNY